jgi:P4 family phage/plasmid primase-like protien
LFKRYGQCNIALIQGKISGCKFVIDIDGEQADEIFQEAVDTLPESLARKIYNSLFVKTGSSWGLHLHLRYDPKDFPEGLNLSSNRKVLHRNGERNEIAVKADGSYVIAPGSISSSGNQYRVLKGDWDNIQLLSKDEIEQFFSSIAQISEKHKEILVRWNNGSGAFEKQQEDKHQEIKQIALENKEWIIKTVTPFMIDTHKHNTKFALAGILRKDYSLSEEQTFEIINVIHNDPHKNSLTVRDIYRREGPIVGYTLLAAELSRMTDGKSVEKIIHELKSRSGRERIRHYSSDEYRNDLTVVNVLEDPKSSERDKMAFLVEEVRKKYTFKTFSDTGEILYYNSGKYHRGGRQLIIKELEKIAGYSITSHNRNEVIHHIIARTMVDRDDFDKDQDIINVKNCLIDIRTGKSMSHDSSYLSLIQLPVNYNPKANPRKILDFLYNVLHPSDVALIIEYIAYCLIRDTKLQKDLICVGGEDNGKSILLKLISAFLGPENISSRTLHSLIANQFATADLYGKLANIFADISSKKLVDIETFKVLSSGDRISAEHKHQYSFEFEPHAKLIFSANRLPIPSEDIDDLSYYKRWLIIEFALREYCFFCDKKILKDADLIDKLTREEELSGLLNVVLIAAKRLLPRHRFVKSPSVQDIKNRYQALADHVKAWMDERCVVGPEYSGDKNLLHSDFIKYCWNKKLKRLELNSLGRELAKYSIEDRQMGPDKKHVWSGISLGRETKEQ